MKYEKLYEFIKKNKNISFKGFASLLGISYSALNYKFIGKQSFTLKQIKIVKATYKLSAKQVEEFFYE